MIQFSHPILPPDACDVCVCVCGASVAQSSKPRPPITEVMRSSLHRISDRTWEEFVNTLPKVMVFHQVLRFPRPFMYIIRHCNRDFLVSVVVFLRRALIFSTKTGSYQSSSPHKPLAVVNQKLLVAFIHYSDNRLLSFNFHIRLLFWQSFSWKLVF